MDTRSTGGPESDEYFRLLSEHVGELLSLDPDRDAVLDVGCDSGLVTRHVAGSTCSLVGMDFVPGMVRDAHSGNRPGNLRYLIADGTALPFAPSTFSKAYSYDVLGFVEGAEQGAEIIAEMIRVCRPGGLVLAGDMPDQRKKWAYLRGELALGAGWLRRWRRLFARALSLALRRGPAPASGPMPVWYDVENVKQRIDAQGHACELIDQPSPLRSWCYRTNLRVRLRGSQNVAEVAQTSGR